MFVFWRCFIIILDCITAYLFDCPLYCVWVLNATCSEGCFIPQEGRIVDVHGLALLLSAVACFFCGTIASISVVDLCFAHAICFLLCENTVSIDVVLTKIVICVYMHTHHRSSYGMRLAISTLDDGS